MMKIARLFSLAAVSFALASATTACSWFQDDSEEHISRFYQPDDGITRDAKDGGKKTGEGSENPFDRAGLDESDGAGDWDTNPAGGEGDGEMYADFGTRIQGVKLFCQERVSLLK